MFSSRIVTPISDAPTSEDIFESALMTIFTDVTQNSHGVPGASVTYHSPRFGPMSLRIPAHPDVEDGRKLFAHYLWNAGVIAADAVEAASSDEVGLLQGNGASEEPKTDSVVDWDRRYWNVRGKRVLELGAATALPSLIAALSGAAAVVITDHPSSPALTTGAIQKNVHHNITERQSLAALSRETSAAKTAVSEQIQVLGYTWGTKTMHSMSECGKPVEPLATLFHRIVIADCLWMPSQHANIVRTILHYLDDGPQEDGSVSCALVVAGFHTGRAIVSNFFDIATGGWEETERPEIDDGATERQDPDVLEVQGRLCAVEMFEIDVDGNKRPWEPVREGETKDHAKRWCVCAVLVKRC